MRKMFWLLWNDPKTVRKFIVALLTAVAVMATNGLVPPDIEQWVDVALSFIGALGVYGIYNEPVEGDEE